MSTQLSAKGEDNQPTKLANWRSASIFISFVFAASIGNLIDDQLRKTRSKYLAFVIGLLIFLSIMSGMLRWINKIEKRKKLETNHKEK